MSAPKFKAVCTDIDGTLLDATRQLSPNTISVFKSLPADVAVILASSRMPGAMRHLQDELGILNSPLICYNGGYVIQETDGDEIEVLNSIVIPLSVCRDIAALAAGTSVHVSVYHRDEWYAPSWDYWAEREATITKVEPVVLPLEEVLDLWQEQDHGAHKVMCMGPEEEIERMEKTLIEKFSRSIHVYRSRPTYLELAPSSISKGSALGLLLKHKYNFSLSEVIAFGDNYNDVELLRMAGHGVAVANSRQAVIEVANEIAPDSKADGVAITLKKYFI